MFNSDSNNNVFFSFLLVVCTDGFLKGKSLQYLAKINTDSVYKCLL